MHHISSKSSKISHLNHKNSDKRTKYSYKGGGGTPPPAPRTGFGLALNLLQISLSLFSTSRTTYNVSFLSLTALRLVLKRERLTASPTWHENSFNNLIFLSAFPAVLHVLSIGENMLTMWGAKAEAYLAVDHDGYVYTTVRGLNSSRACTFLSYHFLFCFSPSGGFRFFCFHEISLNWKE